MKLYLVRHGQTEGNLAHIYQNDTDKISDKGLQEAEFLAKRFESIVIDQIISSPYSRAHETAEKVAAVKKISITSDPLLVEKRWPKEIEGRSSDDSSIKDIIALLKEKELSDPEWRYSDEERFIDVRARCVTFLSKMEGMATSSKGILIVSHAHTLKVLLAVVIHGKDVSAKLFRDIFYSVSLHNTGITALEHSKERWNILTLNDHAHLGEYHRQPH